MPAQYLDLIQHAYTQMAMARVEQGFEPFFLTLMFNPLHGSDATVARNMERATETLYANLLTRMVRHPARTPLVELPMWIVCPDYPVPKHAKKKLTDVAINDGRHLHACLLNPPKTRLTEPFNLYVARHADRYTGPHSPLARIDVVKLHETPEVAIGYGLKALGRGRATTDDILVLPRTHSEMRD